MALFATYGELRQWGADPAVKGLIKEATRLEGKTTFLSHTSKDDDKVAGAARILENHGARVYLDHGDPNNQTTDCVAIADHIRRVINSCRKFVMFATPLSSESKWMPWELGLADGIHSHDHVALFPAADSAYEQDWAEREYLGLYEKIVWSRIAGYEGFQWVVMNTRDNTGQLLRSWLSS